MQRIDRMKKYIAAALAVMAFLGAYAQTPPKVEAKVNALVQRYDDVNGVECMTLVKGKGLEMVKMMFNKQFGKEFMRGVTSITIIEYSEASQETYQALRKEFDSFELLLEEFDLSKEKDFAGDVYVRSFGQPSDKGTLSDFVMALEDKDSKMFMYMAGVIKVE